MNCNCEFGLSDAQIQEFIEHGVLVVEKVLSLEELRAAQEGLSITLGTFGIDTQQLSSTGHALQLLSSTNGSGGVLDIFYPKWKMKIATHQRLFHMTTQLWQAAFCHGGESLDSLDEIDIFRWHPYGEFDCDRGFLYIDRVGYRLPTLLAEQLGQKVHSSEAKKKRKPLQRSLTPHLDCCPDNLFENKVKWRPIQCFVSLTDNFEAETGGFEAAKGFHRTFHQWIKNRPPTKVTQKINGKAVEKYIPAPCIGEYTHIRPTEDRDVMDRIVHIPVQAGSAVLWDNRIPHSNAYRHYGDLPRAVVYCSFLPDVEINRRYVEMQLSMWRKGQPPTDQWINIDESDERQGDEQDKMSDNEFGFTPLGRQLMGIDPWS
jgi:hypothetical protein